MHIARTLGLTLLACSLATMGASKVRAAGCPPLGQMPTYKTAGDPTLREYDSAEFQVKKGDDAETVTVAGRKCVQPYELKEGANPLSDREIQANYRDQLKKLGATILFTGDRDTYARLDKGGQETWLYVYSQETGIEVTVLVKQPPRQTLAVPSGNDYRIIGHMPNYVADKPEKRNFDAHSFTIKDGDDTRDISVEGATFHVSYSLKDGAPIASDLEIQTNYRNALKALGAEVLLTDPRNTTARLENNGQSIWINVYSQETGIEVTTVEEKQLQLSIKPPEASALKSALDKEGHVALHINFDFNKATLKPDAAAVIAQIVKLLKDNPALKIAIEGHTDNVGTHDYNVKLSQDRAAAVVAAIVGQGIAKERLTSAGYGPDKPVGDNVSAEGRAQNRRVELVKA